MTLRLFNGQLLIKNGLLAAAAACCCCDPPCDSDLCEECVGGQCVSTCGEGQYCCDGVCQDEPCGECDCTDCGTLVWAIDPGDEDQECQTEFGSGVDGNFSRSDLSGTPTWGANAVWKPGYPAALDGKCYQFVTDEAGCPQPCDETVVYYSWLRIRLFVYDCESQSVNDITSDAIEPRECDTCEGYVLRDDLCGDPDFSIASPLPFNDAEPTVTCNPLP